MRLPASAPDVGPAQTPEYAFRLRMTPTWIGLELEAQEVHQGMHDTTSNAKSAHNTNNSARNGMDMNRRKARRTRKPHHVLPVDVLITTTIFPILMNENLNQKGLAEAPAMK
jgi:hypothetical protein